MRKITYTVTKANGVIVKNVPTLAAAVAMGGTYKAELVTPKREKSKLSEFRKRVREQA